LRGDADGVAAQVFIKDSSVLPGLIKSVSNDIEAITNKFWPGPLSITFNAQPGLSWNLGDDGRLGTVNIRVPANGFLTAVLKNTGPLAAASAALTSKAAILDLAELPIYESDIGVIFSDGILTSMGRSTVIDATGSQLKVKRSGVIDAKELSAVIPNILL
jgi:tRNA A37 threonylcarbamoyladenosine synthetase subunit TsaC/SUA5/YrdC